MLTSITILLKKKKTSSIMTLIKKYKYGNCFVLINANILFGIDG